MDFQTQMNDFSLSGAPLPYYLAYSGEPCAFIRNMPTGDNAAGDFEYFRRTYPVLVAKYQRRVEEILDRIDYEGSMIYDEYPDRLSLNLLADTVGRLLDAEESGKQEAQQEPDPLLRGLIQVLVCNEIYRRRHRSKGILQDGSIMING